MGSDYGFTKIWVGKGKTEGARQQFLDLFAERTKAHGFTPVAKEDEGAHFTILLLDAGTGWLHFDAYGHYLPRSERRKPGNALEAILAEHHPVISYYCSDDASYRITRWQGSQVIARYISSFFTSRHLYEDPEAARAWFPVYADWQDLLQASVTEADFVAALPAPFTKANTPPRGALRLDINYPETFRRLFGWEPALNGACIAFNPEGNPGRGDFWQLEAGDYVEHTEGDEWESEAPAKVIIHARHYAHPAPGDDYDLTWDEHMFEW